MQTSRDSCVRRQQLHANTQELSEPQILRFSSPAGLACCTQVRHASAALQRQCRGMPPTHRQVPTRGRGCTSPANTCVFQLTIGSIVEPK
eukprot:scaffold126777_cov21-Tisochrysis_lutea.AAC.3